MTRATMRLISFTMVTSRNCGNYSSGDEYVDDCAGYWFVIASLDSLVRSL